MCNQRKLIGFGFAAVLLIGAVIVLYCFDPAKTALFPPCPVHFLTGQYCPGCGSLRAIHSLLHGHVANAISLNPLMVISLPILGLMLFNPPWVYKRWVPWVAFVVLISYGIIRNIPVWPFVLLAPK